MRRALAALLFLVACASQVSAQDDGGIGYAPKEARAIVSKAVRAMGGPEALKSLKTAIMKVDPGEKGRIRERHSLKLKGRWMHYASRRRSGAGFDVILARGQTFLCDRDAKGNATYVESLTARDAKEGSYERDILFMPLLLVLLLEKNARMDYRGKNSVGDDVIRAQVRPADKSGQPFVIRLRFDKDTHLLKAAMGTVPWGTDKGKKRYCYYGKYRAAGTGGLKLPHELTDQRGKSKRGRTFGVTWELNKPLPPEMFMRPNVDKKE